jgi:hypothetical protein
MFDFDIMASLWQNPGYREGKFDRPIWSLQQPESLAIYTIEK